MINPETTVREIAAHHPQTLEVFDEYGIDYCCGGGDRLADATASRGIDLSTLVERLEQSIARTPKKGEEARDWTLSGMGELADHIVARHHAFLQTVLPRLHTGLDMVARVHGPNHGEVLFPLQRHFEALRADIEAHRQKEEQTLFPLLKGLEASREGAETKPTTDCDTIRRLLEETTAEHNQVGHFLHEMREISSNYDLPADACVTFSRVYQDLQALESDVHRHIHLENNILFPRALELTEACD